MWSFQKCNEGLCQDLKEKILKEGKWEMGQAQAALIDKNLCSAHRVWAVIESLGETWGTSIPGSFGGRGCQAKPSHHDANWPLSLQAQCPLQPSNTAAPPLLSQPSPDSRSGGSPRMSGNVRLSVSSVDFRKTCLLKREFSQCSNLLEEEREENRHNFVSVLF